MTLEDLENTNPEIITVKEAASIMKVTPRFLQVALQQDKFPFGVGVHMGDWEFYINTTRFVLYMEGSDLINKPA
ncbi:MAG: hypothetical protein WC365_05820 [Candidatus Babeliales bacterium]|jgi:hypothetical protein